MTAFPPEHYETTEEKLKALEDALKAFLENPHCETTISEGKHTRYGLCKTCADQYNAGMLALLGRKS